MGEYKCPWNNKKPCKEYQTLKDENELMVEARLKSYKEYEEMSSQQGKLVKMLERHNIRLKNQVQNFGYVSQTEVDLFGDTEQLLNEIKEDYNAKSL